MNQNKARKPVPAGEVGTGTNVTDPIIQAWPDIMPKSIF